jgi:hypothetical protein
MGRMIAAEFRGAAWRLKRPVPALSCALVRLAAGPKRPVGAAATTNGPEYARQGSAACFPAAMRL